MTWPLLLYLAGQEAVSTLGITLVQYSCCWKEAIQCKFCDSCSTLFCLPQEKLVEACITDGNLKDALRLVNSWGLQHDYPDLEAEYEERTMDKLLNKSLWNAASGFAIGKPKFQAWRTSCSPDPTS